MISGIMEDAHSPLIKQEIIPKCGSFGVRFAVCLISETVRPLEGSAG